MPAGRLGAHLAAGGDLQPVGDLLQIVERLGHLPRLGQQRRAGVGAAAVLEGVGEDLRLPLALGIALHHDLVRPAVEDQVEPSVLAPRLPGAAERAGHLVDHLDRRPLRALGAHRIAAEAVDGEDRLLPAAGRHLGRGERDLRGSRSPRGEERAHGDQEKGESEGCRPGVEHRVPSMWGSGAQKDRRPGDGKGPAGSWSQGEVSGATKTFHGVSVTSCGPHRPAIATTRTGLPFASPSRRRGTVVCSAPWTFCASGV